MAKNRPMHGEDEGVHDDLEQAMRGMSMQQREMALRQIQNERIGGHTAESSQPQSKNFTFKADRMNDIGRENHVLLQKLQSIAVKGSNATGSRAPTIKIKASSNEINRRKKEKEIAMENYKIAQRLISTKSATFDRKKMQKDSENQEKYLRNAAVFPVSEKVHSAPPRPKSKVQTDSRPPWFRELPKGSTRVTNRPEWQD